MLRFENEKLLMAMYGVDCEESTLGQDVGKDSRSYFANLLHEGVLFAWIVFLP